MSGMHDAAKEAMTALLAELPAEFSMYNPNEVRPRESFTVIKERNVRTVHQALWDLQEYLGMK